VVNEIKIIISLLVKMQLNLFRTTTVKQTAEY